MLRKPAFWIVLSPVAKQLEFYPFHGCLTVQRLTLNFAKGILSTELIM